MLADDFDLDAYLTRIGVRAARSPGLGLLSELVAHHASAIPFENLDIVLGRPIRLDIGAIQAKLVDARRGGYCYEQNTLLRAALERLGFCVTSSMARVVRTAPLSSITPRTHMLLRVSLPEGTFLVDVGFGNLTPTAPLMLGLASTQATEHEDYRLVPLEGETLLQARLGEAWENVYRFNAEISHPIDHEVGNWFTSTRPGGLFTDNVIAARPSRGRRTTLFNGIIRIRDSANTVESIKPRTEPALRDALQEHFGITLNNSDVAAIHAASWQFSERTEPGLTLD